jgi:hypothetical protein
MIRRTPLKYTVVVRVEANNAAALEDAVKYVAAYLKSGVSGYVCGSMLCVCQPEVEWLEGRWLVVRACIKSTVRTAAKLLVKAYRAHGGREIKLVRCEEHRP